MLLLPNKRVWRYQITLIVVLAITLSSMVVIISLQPIIQNSSQTSSWIGVYQRESMADYAKVEIVNPLLEIISSLIFIIGILILIESLFFWVPSLTDLTVNKNKGKMIWFWKRFRFPERAFTLLDTGTKILIRRKRSSLKGLLMREFIMEIHISKDRSEIKRISDFTGITKIIQKTPSQTILMKTVMLKSLPLQILQIRTLLASKVNIPMKTPSTA